MTTHTDLAALLPCPFCGLTHALKVVSAEELANEGDDDAEPWMHSPSFAVVCDASRPDGPGGCGSQGGFKPTEAEAVENWNRRAALSTERLAGGGELLEFLTMTEAQVDDELRRLGIDPVLAIEMGANAVARTLISYTCRLCGHSTPHTHTAEEILIFRNGMKAARAIKPQAERVPLSDEQVKDAARWRQVREHWKNAKFTFRKTPENTVKTITLLIDFDHTTTCGANDLERELDAARTRGTALASKPLPEQVAQDVIVDAYAFPSATQFGEEIKVQRTRQIEGPALWKVVDGKGNCLNKSGEWEWEPMPSSRGDEFLSRCRFPTADAAINAVRGIGTPKEST